MERRFGFKRLEKKVSTQLGKEEFKESLSVIGIERGQFHTLPRMEVCEATVGYVRPKVLLGNR